MKKHCKIETTKEAVDYLQKVLNWKAFCDSHKRVAESIEVLLKQLNQEEKGKNV